MHRLETLLEDVERTNDALLAAQSELGEGVLFVDGERVMFASDAAERLLGRSQADLLGLPSILDLVVPGERGRFADVHLRRLSGEDLPGRERVAFARPNGPPLTLDVNTRIVRSPDATRAILVLRLPVETTSVETDADDVRRLQAQLQDVEARYDLLARHSESLVALLDADGRYAFASPSFLRVLGIAPLLVEGNVVTDLMHPEDHPVYRTLVAEAVAGRSRPAVVRFRHADRSWRWVRIEASRIDFEGIHHTLLTGQDISERRGTEAERAHVAAILDRVHDAVVTIALDGQIIGWNGGAERVYGYAAKEMIGRNLSILVPPGAPDDAPLLLERLRAGDVPLPFNGERRRKDGTRIHVHLTIVPVRDASESVVGASILAADITERQRLQRLRDAQNEVDRILAEAPTLQDAASRLAASVARGLGWDIATLWLADAGGDVLRPEATWTADTIGLARFADTTSRTTARRGEGVIGIVWATGRPLWIRDVTKERRMRRAAVAAADGLHACAAVPVRTTAGPQGVLEFFAHERRALDDDAQRVLLSIGSQLGLFMDRNRAVEETRRLNQELEQRVTERTRDLETSNRELEAFSYSVSHDLKAPLRTIDGFTRSIEEDYGGRLDDEGRYLLERIHLASTRMGRLIDELLKLSRATSAHLRKQDVDVTALVLSVAGQLQATDARRHVDVRVAPGLRAEADPDLLRVALENLVANAWKFTRKRPDARIDFTAEQYADETVFVLRDNGAGFDMTYAAKLFQPFERLHPVSEFEGSGIGLATVHRVISRHNGRIWAEATPGGGATFRFTLGPAPPAAAVDARASSTEPAPAAA